VNFRITRHSAWKAPDNALDLLWERLGPRREQASFTKTGTDIRARWGADAPISMGRDEREEIARVAILDIVQAVCEQAPELKSDWYAVSVHR
jgi:hypothetical protein